MLTKYWALNIIIIVGVAAGSGASVWAFVRLVVGFKPLRWFVMTVISKPVAAMFEFHVGGIIDRRMDPTIELVQKINKEMHPNNGSTFRDLADRIREDQLHQGDKLFEATKKLDVLHRYTHDFRHDMLSEVSSLKVAEAAQQAVVDKLGEVVGELRARRKTDPRPVPPKKGPTP